MTLLSGKSNIGHNMKVEEMAGKPHPQALAIALSVSRRKKKMAQGGEIQNEKLHPMHEPYDIVKGIMEKRKMAHGGLMEDDDEQLDYNDGNFLSDEEQNHALTEEGYPDPMGAEETEGMEDPMGKDPQESAERMKNERLGRIMKGIHGYRYHR